MHFCLQSGNGGWRCKLEGAQHLRCLPSDYLHALEVPAAGLELLPFAKTLVEEAVAIADLQPWLDIYQANNIIDLRRKKPDSSKLFDLLTRKLHVADMSDEAVLSLRYVLPGAPA